MAATPNISSLAPAAGAVGQQITINGSGFGASQGDSFIIFAGGFATPISWSDTQIVTTVPVGAGTGPVLVFVYDLVSNGVTFTTLNESTLASIVVTPVNPSITASGSLQFTAMGRYPDNSTQDLTHAVTWSSSAPGVATIGAMGLATTVGRGSTIIQASLGSLGGSTTLTVNPGSARTGNMNAARAYQTATLLDNGTVLVAGGNGLSSAELYSPTAKTFTVTGSMETARSGHTATLLGNGTVLVTGGPDNTAELYNPNNSSFTPTGNMTTARSSHTATLLDNGLVLIVGGYDSNFFSLASAELYDPATGTFSATGNLVTGRANHTATLLNNGEVLVTGGYDINGTVLASAELYDPVTQTFAATANMNSVRVGHTATLLNGGKVLIVGGVDNSFDTFASAELYDPTAGTFTLTGSLNTARCYHTATLLNNGTVLVAGGRDPSTGSVFSSTELYDPSTGTFATAGYMSTSRDPHTSTLLPDGTALIAGGLDFDSSPEASADLYFPATLTPSGLVSISVSPLSPAIPVGAAQIFTATGTFSDNSTQSLSSVTWSSSDGTIATVTSDSSDPGQAFAVGAGSATISACAGSVCGTTIVSVLASQLSITGLSPVSGAAGTPVIIAGTGFGATHGTSTVAFNGVTANVSLWSNAGIIVGVPAGASTGNVVVTVGGVNSNGVAFTVVATPVITGLSPISGVAGTVVTISGSNFGGAQGTSTVTFNGTLAPVATWSDGSITVPVPSNTSSGDVIVSVSGMPSNGVAFSVPGITEVIPQNGPIGALVTISGGGFGATQGSGTVTIGNTPMAVVSWSDTEIQAAVASGTTTGVVGVQQGAVVLSGPIFTVTSVFPYTVSPQSISMLVGQTRTISVTDSSGHVLTGLLWTTTNPSVVSLSTDDPPVITALAPGSAIVYAGEAPISVTVYAGTVLPPGTPVWSFPTGGGAINPIAVPAVPSASGADLFVLGGSGGSVLSSDGSLLRTFGVAILASPSFTGITTSVIPDFSGNAVLKSPDIYIDAQGNFVATHNLTHLNVSTGQEQSLYTFLDQVQLTQFIVPGVTVGPHDDSNSVQVAIPDTTGTLFVQDNFIVNLFNLSTGTKVGSPISLDYTTCNGTNCGWAYVGKMIVAGDGNAYLPYLYYERTGLQQISSIEWDCEPTISPCQTISHLMVLRVSPDGTYTKIQLHELTLTQGGSSSSGSEYVVPPNDSAPSNYGLAVITNAGNGAAVIAPAPVCGQSDCGAPQALMSFVSKDAITAQVDISLPDFLPTLQREDGSYVGTGPTTNNLVAVGPDGSILWQQILASNPVTPLYATSDGGVIVTSTLPVCPGGDIAENSEFGFKAVCQTPILELPSSSGPNPLGTLYTLDQNGNVTGSEPDPGAVYSWTNQWYADPAESISNTLLPTLDLASTFAAIIGGNASHNGTAELQQWFPPLDTCTSAPGCIGHNEAIYNALDDLIARLSDPTPVVGPNGQKTTLSDLAQTQIFNKLGTQYTTGGFIKYLTAQRPRFYDGLNSSYCYDALQGSTIARDLCVRWPQSLASFVNDMVKSNFNADVDAMTETLDGTRSSPLLTFFKPTSIGFANLGRNLGNEGLIWYEALHGMTGKYDSDLEGELKASSACRVVLLIQNSVLAYSPNLNSEVQWIQGNPCR